MTSTLLKAAQPAGSSEALGAGVFKQFRPVLAARVFRMGLTYSGYLLLARYFGAHELGLILLSLSIVQGIELCARVGLDRGLMRFASLYWREGNWNNVRQVLFIAVKTVMLVSVTATLGLLFWSGGVALHIFHQPELAAPLRVLAIMAPLMSLLAVLLVCFQACQQLQDRVWIESVFQPILTVGCLALAMLAGWRLNQLVWVYPMTCAAVLLVAGVALRRRFPELARKGDALPVDQSQALFRFSLPLIAMTGAGFVFLWIDTWMVGIFLTVRDVGIYGIAVRTAMLIGFVLEAFNFVFAPMISSLHQRGEMEQLRFLYRAVAQWSVRLTLPLFLVLVLFGHPILSWFGAEFANEGTWVLIILASAWVVDAAMGSVGFLLLMSGRSGLCLVNLLVACVVNVGLNLLLLPRYGLVGAAIGSAAAIVCLNGLGLAQAAFLLKIRPHMGGYVAPVIAASVSAFVIVKLQTAAPHIPALLLAVVMLGLYVVGLRLQGRLGGVHG